MVIGVIHYFLFAVEKAKKLYRCSKKKNLFVGGEYAERENI